MYLKGTELQKNEKLLYSVYLNDFIFYKNDAISLQIVKQKCEKSMKICLP